MPLKKHPFLITILLGAVALIVAICFSDNPQIPAMRDAIEPSEGPSTRTRSSFLKLPKEQLIPKVDKSLSRRDARWVGKSPGELGLKREPEGSVVPKIR